MRKIYYIFLAGILLGACQKSSVDKKEEGLIRYKETVPINDVPSASLTFFEVTDTRCPGINCLVAGFVFIDISLDGATMDGKITNHIKICAGCEVGMPDTLDYKFAGQEYRFILKSVLPLVRPQGEIKKTDYAISLDIKKK
ncbi:hypothetical protein [Dyadobacter frigoris]|uniref:Lipoprotein n=1 Tax=Dyadobacter frigoris TaxID=2576211 RepID=A0A4U6DBL0_9BACT|nr:hypothetical protein [Dyadobacter frigoris]TKT91724.1 hypothetical protein FDK13_15295 [Dyadobacter frigoris]GLU51707.1 hypothetical protein Dfri01_11680 [Dyadobacter frigoris]